METTYELKISGPDLTFERKLGEEELGRVMAALLMKNETPTPQSAALGVAESSPSLRPKVSIGEFMRQSGVSSNPERIAAIALYLRDHLGQESVRREDLAGWFQKAGLAVPKNVWRDVMKSVKQRLIAEDYNAEGSFYLTQTGEEQLNP